ncbi:MIP/aquaporin family protein [Streptomyces mirabilis]|uniref:MIP/aquaporin family protein n=1 Tax=Streptomyces mirabilis TaxID=68239 RepID=UPI003662A4D0
MAVEVGPLLKSSWLRSRAGLLGECLAEFLGMVVVISFGCGVVAMAVAALPVSGRTQSAATAFFSNADWLLITWGWGLAVTIGIYVAGGVSGAHLNPAVTLAFALRRRFPWFKVIPYWTSQVVGAFTGAGVMYLLYHRVINDFDHASRATKLSGHTEASFSVFATFPAPYFGGGYWGPLIDQIVGTAFLVMAIVAIIDARNTAVAANLGPYVIGLVISAIGMSFGANAGYAINPARDFGPRFFAWLAGWGRLALPGDGPWFSGYWWIPVVGPLIGGVIGVLIYDLLIGDVLRERLLAGEPPIPGCTRPTIDE